MAFFGVFHSQKIYPSPQDFLHGYIRNIRDIMQLCWTHSDNLSPLAPQPLLQDLIWWEGGRWSPLFERKNGNRKCRIPNFEKCLTAETGNRTQKWQSWIQNFNFEKYLTAETGNPTQKGIQKCRIPNFEKYLTAEMGNPTQQYNRKCRISILRNT